MARRVPPSSFNSPSDDGFRLTRTNLVLDRLPSEERKRLEPHLTRVTLEFDNVLYGYRDRIAQIYFPETAVMSLTLTMEDGRTVEVGTVGSEGFLGIPVFLGERVSPSTVICQIGGTALQMPAQVFEDELGESSAFRRALAAATHAFTVQAMHTAACNRLHSIEQRAARWLLMTHDRVGRDRFPLTQQFLAYMLGVYRPSVTLTAISLQKAGLIRYERGAFAIVDRAGLEAVSCECYQEVRGMMDRSVRGDPRRSNLESR